MSGSFSLVVGPFLERLDPEGTQLPNDQRIVNWYVDGEAKSVELTVQQKYPWYKLNTFGEHSFSDIVEETVHAPGFLPFLKETAIWAMGRSASFTGAVEHYSKSTLSREVFDLGFRVTHPKLQQNGLQFTLLLKSGRKGPTMRAGYMIWNEPNLNLTSQYHDPCPLSDAASVWVHRNISIFTPSDDIKLFLQNLTKEKLIKHAQKQPTPSEVQNINAAKELANTKRYTESLSLLSQCTLIPQSVVSQLVIKHTPSAPKPFIEFLLESLTNPPGKQFYASAARRSTRDAFFLVAKHSKLKVDCHIRYSWEALGKIGMSSAIVEILKDSRHLIATHKYFTEISSSLAPIVAAFPPHQENLMFLLAKNYRSDLGIPICRAALLCSDPQYAKTAHSCGLTPWINDDFSDSFFYSRLLDIGIIPMLFDEDFSLATRVLAKSISYCENPWKVFEKQHDPQTCLRLREQVFILAAAEAFYSSRWWNPMEMAAISVGLNENTEHISQKIAEAILDRTATRGLSQPELKERVAEMVHSFSDIGADVPKNIFAGIRLQKLQRFSELPEKRQKQTGGQRRETSN